MSQESNKFLAAALRYAKLGLSVFPCAPNSRAPMVSWKQYQYAPASEAQIREWWAACPNANVAIITGKVSGVAVYDVDPRHGGTASGLPDTGLIAQSPRGGTHHYYLHPGTPVKNVVRVKPDDPYRGIDTRGDGGFVLAPPSSNEHGEYTWIREQQAGPWVELGSQPKPSEGSGQIVGEQEAWIARLFAHGLQDGSRNDSVARLAGYFAGREVPLDVADGILQLLNAKSPSPLDPSEVLRTVQSVYRTERTRAAKATDDKPRLDLMAFSEYMARYEGDQAEWLVDGWLPKAELGMLVSPPEHYKTWLLCDLAVSVATGTDFLGHAHVTTPSPVIWMNLEDPHAMIVKRMTVIMLARFEPTVYDLTEDTLESAGLPHDLPIYFHPSSTFNLDLPNAMQLLEEHVRTLRPGLLMIDPLYYLLPKLDEFMADAPAKLKPLKQWRETYNLTTILAHHKKKSTNEKDPFSRMDAWGSQLLNAFLGFGWQVARTHPDGVKHTISLARHFKNAVAPKPQDLTLNIDTIGDPWTYHVSIRDHVASSPTTSLENQILAVLGMQAMSESLVAEHVQASHVDLIVALQNLQRNGMIVNESHTGLFRAASMTAETPAIPKTEIEYEAQDPKP